MNSPFTDFIKEAQVIPGNSYTAQLELEGPFTDEAGEVDNEELYETPAYADESYYEVENEFPNIYPAKPGVSPFALQAKKQWKRAKNELRPSIWQGKVFGLVVHTSGGSLPGKAVDRKKYPTVAAIDLYTQSTGCNYINGWKGIMAGDLIQIANENKMAYGVGMGDQIRSINSGRFEKDLPAIAVTLWKKKWPGYKSPLNLLPNLRDANQCYLHVECLPVVYYTQKGTVTDSAHPPMRAGLRFTKEQHDSIAILAYDIATRNGWPMNEQWWKSPRLLGHEDLSPISRHDKNGGWDPGGLRNSPYFDWEYVYKQIENIRSSGYSSIIKNPVTIAGELNGVYNVDSLLFQQETIESENPGVENQVTGTGSPDAVSLNEQFKTTLGWGAYIYEINDLLLIATGQVGQSLFGTAFVTAVATWQRKNGFTWLNNNGIIDAYTWGVMKVKLSEFIINSTVRSWGDKTQVGKQLEKIVRLNLSYPLSLGFDKMNPAQKTAFQTEWSRVRTLLLIKRRQFISSGFIPPLGSAKIPFGFDQRSYGSYTGLATSSYLQTERADKVLLSLYQQGKISLTQEELDLFQRIANVESGGKIQVLNSYDAGIVSIGFMQFTIHVGKIQQWIKLNEPAFRRYGIELDPTVKYNFGISGGTPPAIKGVAQSNLNDLRWNGWGERFYYAGLDPDIIVAEVELARRYIALHLSDLRGRLNKTGDVSVYTTFVTHYYSKDAYIKALFQESHNNNPSLSTRAVLNSVKAFSSPTTVTAFLEKYKAVLTAAGKGRLVTETAVGTSLSVTAPAVTPEYGMSAYEDFSLAEEESFDHLTGGDTYDHEDYEERDHEEHDHEDHEHQEENDHEITDNYEMSMEESLDQYETGPSLEAPMDTEEERTEEMYESTDDETLPEYSEGFSLVDLEDGNSNLPLCPAPGYVAGSTPPFIADDFSVPGYTCFVKIGLGKGNLPPDMTGIYVPSSFDPTEPFDLILYMHGMTSSFPGPKMKIDGYWKSFKLPGNDYRLREEVEASGKNVIFVAPSLGYSPNAYFNSLSGKDGGLDEYMIKIIGAIQSYVVIKRFKKGSVKLRNIILAGHSAGGAQIRNIVVARKNPLYGCLISECWGFDSLYDGVDPWYKWAKSNPSIKLFIYYLGSTQVNSETLAKKSKLLPNIFIKRSSAKAHGVVPKEHLKDRIVKIGRSGLTKTNFETVEHEDYENVFTDKENMYDTYESNEWDETKFYKKYESAVESEKPNEFNEEELTMQEEGYVASSANSDIGAYEREAGYMMETAQPFEHFAPEGDPVLFYEDVKVKKGETLIGLAAEYGFDPDDWREIWNDPKNAALKTKRKLSTKLAEGDIIHIPIKWRITNKQLTPSETTFIMTAERSGREGLRLDWVQTVYGHNQPNFPVKPFPAFSVDLPTEDDLPFYWTPPEYDALRKRTTIVDRPNRGTPTVAMGNTTWRAVTSLCVVTGKRVSIWDTFVWGINFNVDGKNTRFDIRPATAEEVKGHLNLLRKKSGKSGKTFTAMGWIFRQAKP